MGLFDIQGFGEKEEVRLGSSDSFDRAGKKAVFRENSFDDTIVGDVHPFLKVDIINKHYNMGKLLENLGYDISRGSMYCPFHPDESTGKPSAKYHEDTDKLYCFSENKMYSSYHVIKLLYGIDTEKVFRDIWNNMSEIDRREWYSKYDENGVKSEKEVSKWEIYQKAVLSKFQTGEVSFTQYKNALYKVLKIVLNEQ